MSRSNRPKRARPPAEEPEPLDADRILGAARRSEPKRDGDWHVQRMPGAAALKAYVCPGCHLAIPPGTPHVVAWRADGLFGEEDDLRSRRHWHSRCWAIRP